tara:strand:- start:5041 stop:5373 length:333 start_codon:yes stop_codon:yes gene_type:complete
MRSPFAEWLDQMQHVADAENITVAARHFDFLDYQFKLNNSPSAAFENYKVFLKRWNAITKNGKFTEAVKFSKKERKIVLKSKKKECDIFEHDLEVATNGKCSKCGSYEPM